MISELHKSKFYMCRDLLYEQGQLEAKAIIEGTNPGRLFVDDLESPSTGLIWLGNNDGFIFIGDEKNEAFHTQLNDFIDSILTPEARKVGLTWFEMVGNHKGWDKVIKDVFEHRKLGCWDQKVYILKKENYQANFEQNIGSEYKVLKMNETLFHNRGNTVKNIEFLRSKILEFWSTPEAFFNKGVGYCVIHENEMVSVCFSGFVAGNVHCIDIETLEAHQGKKLAQKVAQSFVEDCLNHNLTPYWDCMESNKPSVAVAEKLGFRNIFNYKGYEFEF